MHTSPFTKSQTKELVVLQAISLMEALGDPWGATKEGLQHVDDQVGGRRGRLRVMQRRNNSCDVATRPCNRILHRNPKQMTTQFCRSKDAAANSLWLQQGVQSLKKCDV